MTVRYQNIVVGAGVIGCSIAYELSKKQQSTLVLDKNSHVAQGTSLAAGGVFMYNKSISRPEEWHRMASQAIDHHKRLESELRGAVDWNWYGRAEVACADEDIGRIKTKYDLEQQDGKDVVWLTEEDTARRFSLSRHFSSVSGHGFQGYLNKMEGWVNPVKLCHALFYASQNNAAEFRFHTQVQRVFFSNGQGHVVLSDSSVIQAENIIIALGADVASIEIERAEKPEITLVKGESLLLKGSL